MHMIELDFKEPETFKTPDGQEWAIYPLKVKNMRYVALFTKLHNEYTELRQAGKIDEANNLLFGNIDDEEEDPENEKSMVGFSNKMVDLAVKNVENEENFPEKYRHGEQLLSLCAIIVKVTTNLNPKAVKEAMGEEGPFPLKDSSDKPEETSTPSKKSRRKRKTKS